MGLLLYQSFQKSSLEPFFFFITGLLKEIQIFLPPPAWQTRRKLCYQPMQLFVDWDEKPGAYGMNRKHVENFHRHPQSRIERCGAPAREDGWCSGRPGGGGGGPHQKDFWGAGAMSFDG